MTDASDAPEHEHEVEVTPDDRLIYELRTFKTLFERAADRLQELTLNHEIKWKWYENRITELETALRDKRRSDLEAARSERSERSEQSERSDERSEQGQGEGII